MRTPHRRGLPLAALVLVLTACGGRDTPPAPPPTTATADAALRGVVDRAVTAVDRHDTEAFRAVSCDPTRVAPADGAPPDGRARLVAYPAPTGTTAVAQVEVTAGGKTSTVPLTLELRSGTWCVS